MEKKKSMNKIYFAAVVLILILLVGAFVYSNRNLLKFGGGNGAKTVFSFETGQQYQFDSQKGNILALSGDGITSINQNGGQSPSIIRQLSNPCMQNEENFTLLFDRGSKDIAVYSNSSLMWELQTDQPIITTKINQKGYVALVTYEVGYKGKIEIYNQNGELVYKWQLGENYVVDVDVSPDCKYFAAVTISANDVKLTSKISVIDIDGERVLGETVCTDSLIMKIKYQLGGTIVALGEDELVGISAKGGQQWAVDFEGRQLQKFKLPYHTSCVLSFEGNRNNSIIEVYNRKGQKTGEYISENEIKQIDVSDKTISVAEQRSVVLLNLKGKVTAQTEMQKEIRDVMLLTAGKVAVVGSNSVEIIKP